MLTVQRLIVIAASVLLVGGTTIAVLAQQTPPAPPSQTPAPERPAGPDFGRMLVDGLKNTEGCLGVEVALMQNAGMQSIIAWFEDKAAVERWYYSPTHRFMMSAVGDSVDNHTPLEFVEDPDAPVMVIASIRPMREGDEQAIPGPMPISAISIELYGPLPGGAAINARLAPAELDIPRFDWLGDDEGSVGAPTPTPSDGASGDEATR